MTKTASLSVKFEFSSAHFLPEYHGKCEKMHGHNYGVTISIKGPVKEDGMVMDFAKIKKIANEKAINVLDHKNLNEIIENPSAENIAIWIWEQLKNDMPLKKIAVSETSNSTAEYAGE